MLTSAVLYCELLLKGLCEILLEQKVTSCKKLWVIAFLNHSLLKPS